MKNYHDQDSLRSIRYSNALKFNPSKRSVPSASRMFEAKIIERLENQKLVTMANHASSHPCHRTGQFTVNPDPYDNRSLTRARRKSSRCRAHPQASVAGLTLPKPPPPRLFPLSFSKQLQNDSGVVVCYQYFFFGL